MTSSDALMARFLALHPRTIDLSLGRIERLLARLNHPERRLPPVIHVAGTNGKGSTIAFMRAILEAGGLAAHVYTSPHLVRFHERIRIGEIGGGHFVDEDRLADAFSRCEAANDGQPITMFEITTAAALLLFSESPADVLLLEVGLGGRLDATNVIASPACAVVTPIGRDHAEYLGDTVESVATEKAGIFKRGCPAVIAAQIDGGAELWLDGGHNIDGGRILAAAMADLGEKSDVPLVLIVGLARALVAVPITGTLAARPADEVARIGESVGLSTYAAPSVEAALGLVKDIAFERPPRILICGSLYLAGMVLAANDTPPV